MEVWRNRVVFSSLEDAGDSSGPDDFVFVLSGSAEMAGNVV